MNVSSNFESKFACRERDLLSPTFLLVPSSLLGSHQRLPSVHHLVRVRFYPRALHLSTVHLSPSLCTIGDRQRTARGAVQMRSTSVGFPSEATSNTRSSLQRWQSALVTRWKAIDQTRFHFAWEPPPSLPCWQEASSVPSQPPGRCVVACAGCGDAENDA